MWHVTTVPLVCGLSSALRFDVSSVQWAQNFSALDEQQSHDPSAGDNALFAHVSRLLPLPPTGKVPSDEALLQLLQAIPTPVPGMLDAILTPSLVSIPAPLRQTLNDVLAAPLYDALATNTNLPSLLLQSLDITQQVPKLIDEVQQGARDFVPTPAAMSSAARRAYRCRRTLLLEFEDDDLDDSPALEGYLKEAESVMKMKRPMITIDLQRKVVAGNHLTPLLGPTGGEGWGEALEEALGGVLGAVNGGGDEGGTGSAKAVRETLGYAQVSVRGAMLGSPLVSASFSLVSSLLCAG